MNIYAGLLFLHGHVQDTGLARSLAADPVGPDEAAPADAMDGGGHDDGGDRPRAWRRGAISSVCSVALSPFR